MTLLRACAGSTANRATPTSFSYGPTSPNDWPPRNGSRVCHSSETSSARAAGARARKISDKLARFIGEGFLGVPTRAGQEDYPTDDAGSSQRTGAARHGRKKG